ncbi:MAG: hypothetical protein ACRBK7_31695 [Acidimicrobiales bacterium]
MANANTNTAASDRIAVGNALADCRRALVFPVLVRPVSISSFSVFTVSRVFIAHLLISGTAGAANRSFEAS